MVLIEAMLRLAGRARQPGFRWQRFVSVRPSRGAAVRPASFRGVEVPAVLLSGDHAAVARWRAEQARAITQRRRPDLSARAADRRRAMKTMDLVEEGTLRRDLPFHSGDTVRVREGAGRRQGQIRSTGRRDSPSSGWRVSRFTVRKISYGVGVDASSPSNRRSSRRWRSGHVQRAPSTCAICVAGGPAALEDSRSVDSRGTMRRSRNGGRRDADEVVKAGSPRAGAGLRPEPPRRFPQYSRRRRLRDGAASSPSRPSRRQSRRSARPARESARPPARRAHRG